MNEPAKHVPAWQRAWRILRRVVLIIAVMTVFGWTLGRATAAMERSQRPAGFGYGMLHGALMPAALPNLLIGNDVTIYAQRNTGVTYKLGYTCGVNMCGAIFFGFFFWRLNRWRKSLNGGLKRET